MYLRSEISKLVKKCLGQCGRPIIQDDKCGDYMIVKSFGNSCYTDKNGTLQQKYGPQYVHLIEECLLRYASQIHDKSFETFPFNVIAVDAQTMEKLSGNEKDILKNLGGRV